MYVCICTWLMCVCRDLHDTLGQTSWCDRRWTSSIANVFLWKHSVSDITVTVYPFLFVFCDLRLSLYNWDWGRVQSLLVKKWKWVIISTPALRKRVTFDTLFLLEFVHALLTASTPNPSLIPSSSPTNFPPPLSPSPNPRLPSSVCFCSLNSLSVPMSILSLSNYAPSLSLCLVDCKREDSWG